MSTSGYIFGGPDRSGKTTIAKALAELTGAQYYKAANQREIFKNDPWAFHQLTTVHGPPFLHFLESVTIPGGIVFDRFTPCEYAYGRVFQRSVDFDTVFKIDEQLAKLGFIFVFCYKTAYPDWDDPLVAKHRVNDLIGAYVDYCSITQMPFVALDTTAQDLKKQLQRITVKRISTQLGKNNETNPLRLTTVDPQ